MKTTTTALPIDTTASIATNNCTIWPSPYFSSYPSYTINSSVKAEFEIRTLKQGYILKLKNDEEYAFETEINLLSFLKTKLKESTNKG
jgi:hypothetical protein